MNLTATMLRVNSHLSLRLSRANLLAQALSHVFALQFNLRERYRRYLHGADGWLNFSIALRTADSSLSVSLRFADGRVHVQGGAALDADATLIFRNETFARDMLTQTPEELMAAVLKNGIHVEGNMSYMALFNFLITQVVPNTSSLQKRLAWLQRGPKSAGADSAHQAGSALSGDSPMSGTAKRTERMVGQRSDAVAWLNDPYLGQYRLEDFPRLGRFLDIHFTQRPEICVERPLLLTQWFRKHGFEYEKSTGRPWHPVLRQGMALKHLLTNRQPLVRTDDLLGGTTTTREIGVAIYPDAHGTLIWNELDSIEHRALNAYGISEHDKHVLHHDIYPFWVKRNFREWTRERYQNSLCQKIEERFAVYFHWKTLCISHTFADLPKLVNLGAQGIIAEIEARLMDAGLDDDQRASLQAMRFSLEGLEAYADNLSREALRQSRSCADPVRRAELERIGAMCARVPRHPARSLEEALQSAWLGFVAANMESTNVAISLGRMDQWLQPYFSSDMDACTDAAEREAYVRRAIELVGCFFLRCTDHLPLVPEIGNYIGSGSSSDQAVTLGGVTPTGESAVNDMTYVLLKVTELLKLRDPNVNARFSVEKNSDTYLRRLCEVNLITTATPSLHGDENVMASLASHHYPPEHLRDWSATGCVEPTISGRHMAHTGSTMFNLVAPLEMALHDGWHPLMQWQVGPRTGTAASLDDFEAFFRAFQRQLEFLAEQAVEYNNRLGAAHAELRPTPLLSALMDGGIESARDVTRGGARYNTSGVACIGLADVVDSLLTVKQLVYEQKILTLTELKQVLRDDFRGHERVLATIMKKVAKFGSGDAQALAMANRVTRVVHEYFSSKRNYRGGKYTTGFWSVSYHVAFGTLTGALPSGRKSGKSFTAGLTPEADASKNLLDNLRDVAAIDPLSMDNNIAFNVKYVPSAEDGHARSVENMANYAKTYFKLGGMQLQYNVVSTDTLKDAMLHPENYRDLLVRISGYNAYFVTLSREMQIELIERAEFAA